MKVGLYQDVRGRAIGGGDLCLAVLAAKLQVLGHQVVISHHQGDDFLDRLSNCFGISMEGIKHQSFPNPGYWSLPDVPLLHRAKALRAWMKQASLGHDAFVCMTHNPPPFNHAPVGLTYVHFPVQPFSPSTYADVAPLKAVFSKMFHRWLWKSRLRTYGTFASNSAFTRNWTKQYWNVDSKVIHPPVEVDCFRAAEKEKRIAILGRFTASKKQLELLSAFRRHRQKLSGWKLVCIGSLDDDNMEYYRLLEQASDGMAILLPNADRDTVLRELGLATFFWHAMGIDIDESVEPIRVEHFGIATVEAMAAGCIPIVVDRGGQREIVQNKVSGFLCNTLDEFPETTSLLVSSSQDLRQISEAARARAHEFDRSIYESKMLSGLGLN